MRRIGLWTTTIVVVLIVGVVLFVTLFDLNYLRPVINRQVTAAIHRPFAIKGDLGLDWGRDADAGGWRAWVPEPHVHAEDIVLGNPGYIDKPDMVTVKRVDAWLAPLALFSQTVSIPRIAVQQPQATLVKLADGRDNWTFDFRSDTKADDQSASSWTVAIDKIVFDEGRVNYRDAMLDADFDIRVDALGKPVPFSQITGAQNAGQKDVADVDDYVFGWKIDGRYKDAPLSGQGRIGGVLALQSADHPFPVQADVRSGSTRVKIAGTVTQPLNFGGADLDLSFAGESLSNLYALTGITLPATPAYATDGHLDVRIDPVKGSRFAYRHFSGHIGDSDVHGSLLYTQGAPRPKLTGEVVSKQLRFADLAPLIGADSNEHKAERGVTTRQPADKALPVEKFKTDHWADMDADVKFTARRIQHGDTLPLTDLHTHLVLDDGTLLLDPLSFGVAGGELNTTARLSGKREPLQTRVDMHARRLQLAQIVPAVDALDESLGQINGDATFSGTGNSVARLLGGGDGRVTVLIDRGAISRNLMELAGLNVGNYVVGKLFGDEPTRINCAAADIPIKNGLAQPNVFVFDTENAVINITGDTDFKTEKMDLTITPQSKGPRVFTLRSPLYVRGTFANPSPGVKAGPLIARGAAAVALGAVATPAAALLALISPTAGDDNQCQPVIDRIKAADSQVKKSSAKQ